jgi:uncharacterized repeat protein (TIGR01451 family)
MLYLFRKWFNIWFTVLLVVIILATRSTNVYAAGTVTGTIFRDFNADGIQQAREPGLQNASVVGFDAAGSNLGTVLTGVNGTYSYTWIGADATIRLEFYPPAGFQAGAFGANSGTTVQFVSNGAVSSVGFTRPGEYCQANPSLVTTCFVPGDQIAGPNNTLPVVVSFPYNSGSATFPYNPPLVDNPADTTEALANQVGSTWGLAHYAVTNTVFTASFMKRHVGFGAGGPGAIYAINRTAGTITVLTTLNAGVDPHDTTNYTDDLPAGNPGLPFDQVGKMSLGDIDVSDDLNFLYVMNLFDRSLYEIQLVPVGGVPTAGAIRAYAVPNPCAVASDMRPFATGYYTGVAYAGVVCTAESTQVAANMSAHVFALTPGVGFAPAPVLSFALNYSRGCALRSGAECGAAAWLPWTGTFNRITTPFFNSPTQFEGVYPQPWLTDITFDFNGDMVLGIRDRYGDQHGYIATPSPPGDPFGEPLVSADTAGDVLRACRLTAGGWALENNAASPVGCANTFNNAAGAGTGQGPGSGEYFSQDNFPNHDETFMGGLVIVPGFAEVVGTQYDPIFAVAQAFDGGVGWLVNATGARNRAYRLFSTDAAPGPLPSFGKGGGLGDMEAMCNAAPIEIGNYVWLDSDQDGVQDPNETPIAGVVVQLRDPLGNVIATATTDANGHYYFSNLPGTSSASAIYGVPGLTFFTNGYQVTIDLNQTPLNGLIPTQPDVNGNGEDIHDSDGVLNGSLVLATFGTGSPGANNHTYDFGFYPGTLPPPTIPGAGSTPTGTGTNPVVVVQPNPPFSQPGGRVDWVITITNPTDQPLQNVSFTKTEPSNITIIEITTTGGTVIVNGQVITFTIGQILPGQTITIILDTLINTNTPLPFVITNTVVLGAPYSGRFSGRVVSATLLPNTGDIPLWVWVTGIGAALVLMYAGLRRLRGIR